MSVKQHVNDDEKEIHELPEIATLPEGMMVAVDSERTGTKSFNLSTALEGKASAADMTALETTVSGKADASDVTALETAVSGKADTATVNAALAGKEDKVFVAEVNVTLYDDIDTAYNAGKTIVFKYQPSPQGNPGQVYYIKNMQYVPYAGYMCGTFHAMNASYFIVCMKVDNETRWTVSNVSAMYRPTNNPSSGQILSTNGHDNIWIDSPVPSVDTSTDIGKVLAVAANGTPEWSNGTPSVTLYHYWGKINGDYNDNTEYLDFDVSSSGIKSAIVVIQMTMDAGKYVFFNVEGINMSDSTFGGTENYAHNNSEFNGIKPSVTNIMDYQYIGIKAIRIKHHGSQQHKFSTETSGIDIKVIGFK